MLIQNSKLNIQNCIITLFAILFSFPLPAHAGAYPGDEDVIGIVRSHTVQEGESLVELARRYDVGYGEIAAANPGLDPFLPGSGTAVTIPTARIVPEAAEPGTIVVNLSEMRLYYLFAEGDSRLLVTFPIGIGREGCETPLGRHRIVEKKVDPAWRVPPSVRKEKPELPDLVPPGPDNPLGSHALRLSVGDILIHGTNRPWGVGRRVSHGCLRLYPEDIPRLFRLVSVGTPVTVVREPVKVGSKGGRVFIEVHRDDVVKIDCRQEANRLLAEWGWLEDVDAGKLSAALLEMRGIPVDISR